MSGEIARFVALNLGDRWFIEAGIPGNCQTHAQSKTAVMIGGAAHPHDLGLPGHRGPGSACVPGLGVAGNAATERARRFAELRQIRNLTNRGP